MGSALDTTVSWWEGNFFPEAGEVIGWRERRVIRAGEDVSRPTFPHRVEEGAGEAAGSAQTPPGPGEANAERSARRARTRLRRYSVANRLRYLWVLTLAPDDCSHYPCQHVTDLRLVKRQVASFVKRGLRAELGYDAAYAVGYERHRSGAWHINLLVSRRLPHRSVEVAWWRGNVWVERFRSRPGESMRDSARRAAAYVAKYVSKEFDGAAPGVHRYEVAQGFAVRVVRVFALSASGVIEACESGREVYRFDAPAPEHGRGPPIVWAAF